MGKIFCLMGKSSSGKDTVFKLLQEDRELSLKPIIPYTTRPQRNNETNGLDYYFIDEETLQQYNRMGKIIEQREYDTVNGKWYYCTVNDGQIDLAKENYLLIGTLPVYKRLQCYFGKENIIPLYIEVEDATRLERALFREKQQQRPNYEELCRRFLADSNDFCVEKLTECGIKKFYCNNDLKGCLGAIKSKILSVISGK